MGRVHSISTDLPSLSLSAPCYLGIKFRLRLPQNSLIESASHATGSLLIWDTGEYEVLDRHKRAAETDDDLSDVADREIVDPVSENERLVQAFQSVRDGSLRFLNNVIFCLP